MIKQSKTTEYYLINKKEVMISYKRLRMANDETDYRVLKRQSQKLKARYFCK